jgi:hypothetical protein
MPVVQSYLENIPKDKRNVFSSGVGKTPALIAAMFRADSDVLFVKVQSTEDF